MSLVVTVSPFPVLVATRLPDAQIWGLPCSCLATGCVEVDKFPYPLWVCPRPGNLTGAVSFCWCFVPHVHVIGSVFRLDSSCVDDVDDPRTSNLPSAIWCTGLSAVGLGALSHIRLLRMCRSIPSPNAAAVVALLCRV